MMERGLRWALEAMRKRKGNREGAKEESELQGRGTARGDTSAEGGQAERDEWRE